MPPLAPTSLSHATSAASSCACSPQRALVRCSLSTVTSSHLGASRRMSDSVDLGTSMPREFRIHASKLLGLARGCSRLHLQMSRLSPAVIATRRRLVAAGLLPGREEHTQRPVWARSVPRLPADPAPGSCRFAAEKLVPALGHRGPVSECVLCKAVGDVHQSVPSWLRDNCQPVDPVPGSSRLVAKQFAPTNGRQGPVSELRLHKSVANMHQSVPNWLPANHTPDTC